MAILEMQADRPYSYLTGYDGMNHNSNATCSGWPLDSVDNTTQNGFQPSGSMLPPSPPNQPFLSKEIIKQIILQHEATFREQICHLHHLYNKQKELMDEIRNRANRHHLRLEMLQSNPFLSENSVSHAPETPQISSLPWLHYAQNEPATSAARNSMLNASFHEKTGLARSTNEETRGLDRNHDLTNSSLKKIGKKVLDLELPAYEYIDSEEEEEHSHTPAVPGYDLNIACEFVIKTDVEPVLKLNDHTKNILKGDDTAQASSSWRTKPFVDLNEPIVLDDQEEEDAYIEPVFLSRHNELSCLDTSRKTSSQCKVPLVEQMIQNIRIQEDSEDCSNVLNPSSIKQEQSPFDDHEVGKNLPSCQLQCGSDLTETFLSSVRDAVVEQVPEAIRLHDQDCEKSPSYGENFDLESLGSNCYPEGGANCKDMSNPPVSLADMNNHKLSCRKRNSMGTFTIVQALPCADSTMLLSCKFRKTGSAGDKSSWGKKVNCGSRTCCESNRSCVCTSDIEFVSEMSDTKEYLKDLKRNKKVSGTKNVKLVPKLDIEPKSGWSSVLLAKKHVRKLSGSGFTVDSNSCIIETGCSGTPTLAKKVGTRASRKPKVNVGSHSTGESNKNQNGGSSLDELGKIAAEAIVSISSSRAQDSVETQLKHCGTWNIGCLDWFARIVASAINDPTSEYGLALSCELANCNDGQQHYKEFDFFEEMTLNLEEMKEQEYCFNPFLEPEEVPPQTPIASQPRRGRTNMFGRKQRKNFQNEILPTLASLSRHEVTKDLQAIGGLIEKTSTRRNSGSRRSITNEWTKVTKRRRGRPSNADNAGCMLLESQGVGWGNITRGRRGSRRTTPTVPTKFMFRQG